MLLISVWRLQAEAYGLSVRDQMMRLLGREISVGAVYVPLERLKRQGFLRGREAAPTDRRGGRRTRYYRLTPKGVAALSAVREVQQRAWSGLEALAVVA
jgi:PadR family transcriptional regulator